MLLTTATIVKCIPGLKNNLIVQTCCRSFVWFNLRCNSTFHFFFHQKKKIPNIIFKQTKIYLFLFLHCGDLISACPPRRAQQEQERERTVERSAVDYHLNISRPPPRLPSPLHFVFYSPAHLLTPPPPPSCISKLLIV